VLSTRYRGCSVIMIFLNLCWWQEEIFNLANSDQYGYLWKMSFTKDRRDSKQCKKIQNLGCSRNGRSVTHTAGARESQSGGVFFHETMQLFQVLDTTLKQLSKYLKRELLSVPEVNLGCWPLLQHEVHSLDLRQGLDSLRCPVLVKRALSYLA
jgi:hypothetical protein